ncbi:MAG: fumarate reductase subunit C [Betaproteobacteria bacterium]|nr:fumarate reductase subunit C [Betaproteobacteria bacterium]
MAGWWKRHPYYLWYMLREASCVFITAYALILLWGLRRLAQGEGPFEDWLESLGTPGSLAFHALALPVVLYHAWTWFKVMPKTLPDTRLPAAAIVAGGVAASAACSAALLVAVWWFGLWSVP